MRSKQSERIIERLSVKYNLPKRVISFIILTQYEFLRDSIRSATPGEFETFSSVKLKGFGTWKVRRSRMDDLHRRGAGYRGRKAEREAKYQKLKDGAIHNKG